MKKRFVIPEGERYGLVPASMTEDRRFSTEAKAIYSYLLAHAGVMGYVTVPVDKICYDLKMSRNRFYHHIKELKNVDYLTVTKVKSTSTGQYYNLYRLHDPINAYNFDVDFEIERTKKVNQIRKEKFKKAHEEDPFPDFYYTEEVDPEIEELFNKHLQ